MSLNAWVAQTGLEREDCFKHGYRELYLDIGFFEAQFASVEFVLSYLLLVATGAQDADEIDGLVSRTDPRVRLRRLREACAAKGGIGPNLAARLQVFEEQSIPLHDKLRSSTILPGDDWPQSYEFFSALDRLRKVPKPFGDQPEWAEPSENVRADRIWKHGIWLSSFLADLGTVALTWAVAEQFEITAPRTPVLESGVQGETRPGGDDPLSPLTPP